MTKTFEDLKNLMEILENIKSDKSDNYTKTILIQNTIRRIYDLLIHHDNQIYLMKNNITELKNNIKSNDQKGIEMENNLKEQITRTTHEGHKKRNNKKKIKKLKKRVSDLENRISHLELKLQTKDIFH